VEGPVSPAEPKSRPVYLGCVTFTQTSPPDLVRIAAAAGFDGITVRVQPPRPNEEEPWPIRGDTRMMRETQRMLADTGLTVQDVEVIRLKPTTKASDFQFVFEAAARLGAHYVAVNSEDADDNRTADNLAELAAEARAFDVEVWLEFMMMTATRTLSQANHIIELTGRTDIGLMVDALHLDRSGGSPADVAKLERAKFPYLQLCDATRQPLAGSLGGLIMEARAHRLLPGEGALPLVELLRALPGTPVVVECPVGYLLENYSKAEVAEMTYKATCKVLAAE
jgi:sugar phosphate isomerase/epimerase